MEPEHHIKLNENSSPIVHPQGRYQLVYIKSSRKNWTACNKEGR